MFCSLDDLVDEASIQTRFVNPLLAYLGYPSDKIRMKESIDKSPIPEGAKNEGYIPDYVLFDFHDQPVVVLEVRGTSEKNIHQWICLPIGYAYAVNQEYPPGKWPVQYAVLTNGYMLEVYHRDGELPVLCLNFRDFVAGNGLFASLYTKLSYENISNRVPSDPLKLHCPVCGSTDIENAGYGSASPRFRCKKYGHVFT
jgi:hypothetical protein